jgi:shikimate kinase
MTSFLPFSDRNLILTGYIGPDQPLLGRQIAERLRMPYVNIEAQIAERVGLSVDEIRSYYGETRLKAIEAELMQEAQLRRSTVIRVNGRTLLHGERLAALRETGVVVCMVVALDAVLHRLHISMGARYHDPNERALALGELKREWAIRGREGIHEIDTTYLSVEEIITTVIELWRELAIERI